MTTLESYFRNLTIYTRDDDDGDDDGQLSPLDKFLARILQWEPMWLKQKQYDKTPPSIVESERIIQTSVCYKTYNDYYRTVLPLLIHEAWYILKKGTEDKDTKSTGTRTIQLQPIKISRYLSAHGRDSNTNTKTLQFNAEANVPASYVNDDLSDSDSDLEDDCPCRGDFVIISHPTKKIPDVFAYVMDHDRMHGFSTKNIDVICYTLITRKDAFQDHEELRHAEMTTVTSLLSHVHLIHALEILKTSELMDSILRPTIKAYEMPDMNYGRPISIEDKLNPKQIEVVSRVVKSIETGKPRISLIQGPPGTGKSRVIVNIVMALVKNNHKRILLCAPSNKAVDELVLRLMDEEESFEKNGRNLKIVRIGRRQKMDKKVLKHVSLAALVRKRKVVSSLDRHIIENHVLLSVDIIASTLSSSFNKKMEAAFRSDRTNVPMCIVDEAGQAKELETLIPLLLGVKTLVLVGDPKQLPPTILSQKAKTMGLDESLFARAEKNFEKLPDNPIVMLDTQYRMVASISQWPNKFFYGGALKNAAVVPPIKLDHYKILNHSSEQSKTKFSNAGEAKFVVNLVAAIMMELYSEDSKIKLNLGIITPYKEQQALIQSQLRIRLEKIPQAIKSQFNNIWPNTVDSFQGQERDIIIISCVRSNGIGFVNDPNRLCVSLTRAKHSLIICGNFKTFERNLMWNSLLRDAKLRGAYLDIHHNLTTESIKELAIFKTD